MGALRKIGILGAFLFSRSKMFVAEEKLKSVFCCQSRRRLVFSFWSKSVCHRGRRQSSLLFLWIN